MEAEEFATPTAEAEIAGSAPATEEVVAAEETGSAPVETTEEISAEPGSHPTKVVEELKAQRRKRQEAEREAAYWRGVAEAGGRRVEEEPAPKREVPIGPVPPVAPKLDDFETYEQYEAAKDEFLVKRAKYEIMVDQQVAARQREAETVQERFRRQIDEAAARDPQLYTILSDTTLPISKAMAPVIQESDMAPDVLRWLHRNRAEAAKIAQLTPLQAARAIGQIEATLKATPKPSEPKRVSTAPEPVRAVKTADTNALVDEDNLPMDEYYKRYNQRRFAKR